MLTMTDTFAVTSVLSIDHITLHDDTEQITVGSCGFYVAVGLASLGADVLYAGAHGDDFPAEMLSPLRDAGARVVLCPQAGKSAHLYLHYDEAGDVTHIDYQEGGGSEFRAEQLPADFWTADGIWLGSAPDELHIATAKRAAQNGQRVYLSTQDEFAGRFESLAQILPHLTMLFLNSGEVLNLGIGDFDTTFNHLFAINPALEVIITRNGRGAWRLTKDSLWQIGAAPDPHIVNTTGAGDIFAAAYAIQTLRDVDMTRRLQWATAAAALQLRGYAYECVPTVAEVDEYLESIVARLPVVTTARNAKKARRWLLDEQRVLQSSLS